ncbi:MAG TPA: methyl-accepting chemotaxis protein [Rubrivivax sp.]|nr:methyl-accepting chemotaxis protein [Rubrivivax sp.]HPO18168.1 methyl-accepting chemotaxis protein [Rubrivivax sp.]
MPDAPAAAAAPRRAGFFAHHGIWAPGVRLFRDIGFTAKAVIISLAFMLPMLGLLGWLLQAQTDRAEATRLRSLRQPVALAHGLAAWAHAQQRSGVLAPAQAQQLAQQALAALRTNGGHPVWVRTADAARPAGAAPDAPPHAPPDGAPDGAPLAGGPAPGDAPPVQPYGAGFVSHAGAGGHGEQVSYMQRFEPWGWTLGATASLDDLQSGLLRQLAWAGGVVALAQLVAGYLFLSFYRVMDGGLRETKRHMRAMTAGDLTTSPRGWGRDESAQVMQELGRVQGSLRGLVRSVRQCSDGIVHASGRMAGDATDLSARTEHAAAALVGSSTAMARIAAQVAQGVTHTEEASKVARHNAELATDGERVMREVVQTMEGIRGASARIGEIVGTIDGIAFQTNILALNAAVEAARAGAQGRGFAVVANEVRMLAQRSAAAAKEIKELIGGSVQQVHSGTVVVRKAGAAMQEIVAASQRVSELLGEVACGAREQSRGIDQVGQAVQQLDGMTQQNAALVERTAASAAGMRELARTLAEEVARYRMPGPAAREAAPAG